MVGDLQFEDGYKLPFYMIHHTAQYYSPQEWYDFLNKEIPEVVSFLGKKSFVKYDNTGKIHLGGQRSISCW